MKKSFFIAANPILTKEIVMKIGSIINNFWNVPTIPAFDLSDCQNKSLNQSPNSPKYIALAGQIRGINITGIDQIARYFKFFLPLEKIKQATNGMNVNAGSFVKIEIPRNIPEKIDNNNFFWKKYLLIISLVDCLFKYIANNKELKINGNWIGSNHIRLRSHVMGTTAKIAADKRPIFLLYLICPILYIRYVSKTASNPIKILGIW